MNTGIVIIQGLLLIPLYLHFIGVHNYGLWLASGGMLGFLGLVNLGISSLMIQRIARAYAQQNLPFVGAYFINGAFIYLCISLLYITIGWFASIWLPLVLKVTGEDAELLRHCFQIAVVAMAIGVFNECLRSFSQAILRPMIPMISMVVGRIIGICVTIWMLFNDFGLWSIPVGTLVSESVIFVLNMVHVLGLYWKLEFRMNLNRTIITEYMKTSPVLLLARVGDTLSKQSDPLLITMLLSPELTTAYMVVRRAADMVFQLFGVIVGSTMGAFSHLAGSGDIDKTSSVARKLLIFSFSVSVIGFATYAGSNQAFVSLWVSDALVLDQNIIIFIALGFLARSFRGMLWQMLYGLGDFSYPSIIIFLEGIARISMVLWLLSVLGLIGVPIAFTLTCLVSIVPLGLRLRKVLAMRFNLSSMARLLFSAVVLFGFSIMLAQLEIDIDSWIRFALYLFVIITGALFIYASMNWARCRDIYRSIVT